MWKVYIVKCADQTLYTGITNDLKRRISEHNWNKLWAKYTKFRQPVKLVYHDNFFDRSQASKQEARIKKLTKNQKLELINNFMKNLDLEILEYIQTIPKWKVTTYKLLADRFGVHPRKIASVMRYNKHPDVYPCYKVISHSRELGGYSGYDGISSKIKMLKSDWVKIVDGKVLEECII